MSTPDRIPTEHEEQRELVRWFRQTWPGVRIHAIPNGGARSKGGSLSPEQKDWIAYLEGCGYQCVVGKGAEDAKLKITEAAKSL